MLRGGALAGGVHACLTTPRVLETRVRERDIDRAAPWRRGFEERLDAFFGAEARQHPKRSLAAQPFAMPFPGVGVGQ